MKNGYKYVFVLMAFAAVGCGGESDANNTAPITSVSGNCNTNIPFFQTGKVAKYQLYRFGEPTGYRTITYGNCIGTGLLSTIEFSNDSDILQGTTLNRMWQDGVWLYNDLNNDGFTDSKSYKKDAQLGDTWTETFGDNDVVTQTVVDIDSLITVPAGSFHCKVYRREDSDLANDFYIFWNDQYGQIMEDMGDLQYEMIEHN